MFYTCRPEKDAFSVRWMVHLLDCVEYWAILFDSVPLCVPLCVEHCTLGWMRG